MEDHRASGMVLLLARSRIARLPISSGPEAPAEPLERMPIGHGNEGIVVKHEGPLVNGRELPTSTYAKLGISSRPGLAAARRPTPWADGLDAFHTGYLAPALDSPTPERVQCHWPGRPLATAAS